MKILLSRLGVPYLITDDEEVIALTHAQTDDLVATELVNPGTLDVLMSAARVSIEELTGIDRELDEAEWWTTFNGLLAVNEFTTPLHVISQARRTVASIPKEELDE